MLDAMVANVLMLNCFQSMNFLLKQEMHASLLLILTPDGRNLVAYHAKLVTGSALILIPSERLIGTGALLAQSLKLLVTMLQHSNSC